MSLNYDQKFKAQKVLNKKQADRLLFEIKSLHTKEVMFVLSFINNKFIQIKVFFGRNSSQSLRIIIDQNYLVAHFRLYFQFQEKHHRPLMDYLRVVLPGCQPSVRLQKVIEASVLFAYRGFQSDNNPRYFKGDFFSQMFLRGLKNQMIFFGQQKIKDQQKKSAILIDDKEKIMVLLLLDHICLIQEIYGLESIGLIKRGLEGYSVIVFDGKNGKQTFLEFKAENLQFFTISLLQAKQKAIFDGRSSITVHRVLKKSNRLDFLKNQIQRMQKQKFSSQKDYQNLLLLYQDLIQILSSQDNPQFQKYLGQMKRVMGSAQFMSAYGMDKSPAKSDIIL